MEKNIKRLKYYSDNRYGFAIYLISRLYNDLNIKKDSSFRKKMNLFCVFYNQVVVIILTIQSL